MFLISTAPPYPQVYIDQAVKHSEWEPGEEGEDREREADREHRDGILLSTCMGLSKYC